MKKTLLTIISFSLLLSQQLEVDGNLKVTGEIDAQGQAIKNVGVPQSATDAVNLATAQGLAGMKPERIYKYEHTGNGWIDNFAVVPVGKIWLIKAAGEYIRFRINGTQAILSYPGSGFFNIAYAFQGDIIDISANSAGGLFYFFEYSIQSSGTDQGMDYIVP